MIRHLAAFYRSGRLVLRDDPNQQALYRDAFQELRRIKEERKYRIHTTALLQLRDEIQREFRLRGLQLDLYHIPVGIHSTNGNYYSMVVKHFLREHGFTVFVSEEDYSLLGERRKRPDNRGLLILKEIFGSNVDELLDKYPRIQGGDPDLFAFLKKTPSQAWFVEAKGPGDTTTETQSRMFPAIQRALCPVEIAYVTA